MNIQIIRKDDGNEVSLEEAVTETIEFWGGHETIIEGMQDTIRGLTMIISDLIVCLHQNNVISAEDLEDQILTGFGVNIVRDKK